MKKLLLTGFFICNLLCLYGQDLRNALDKMQEEFKKSRSFSIKMTVRVYEDRQQKNPFFTDVFHVRKEGENYHYSYSSNDLLMNSGYLLMIDKQERQILVSPRDTNSSGSFSNLNSINIDSMLSFYEKVDLKGVKNGDIHFQVLQEAGPVRQVDLYIRQDSNLISRLSYHYENQQYVEIVFDRFELNVPFEKATFSEGRYIKKENGKWMGVGQFAHYEVNWVNL